MPVHRLRLRLDPELVPALFLPVYGYGNSYAHPQCAAPLFASKVKYSHTGHEPLVQYLRLGELSLPILDWLGYRHLCELGAEVDGLRERGNQHEHRSHRWYLVPEDCLPQ